MNIQIGLYEFFGNFIPGLVYLTAYLLILESTGLVNYYSLPFIERDFILPISVVIIILSYIIGFLMDTLVSKIWFKVKPQDTYVQTKFDQKFNAVGIKINKVTHYHAYSLFAKIRLENLELANIIERDKVLSVTLRNLGAAIFLLTCDQIIRFFDHGSSPLNLCWQVLSSFWRCLLLFVRTIS